MDLDIVQRLLDKIQADMTENEAFRGAITVEIARFKTAVCTALRQDNAVRIITFYSIAPVKSVVLVNSSSLLEVETILDKRK